jgi:outer membrane protein assembly factor BamB
MLVLGWLIAASLHAGERAQWAQFRGPNGSGVSLEKKRLPVHFGPAKNVAWKTPLPSGHSSPCLWNERIFLTAFHEDAQKLETLCLDRANGKILWRKTAPAKVIEKVHKISSPAAPTPATDGERVYVYFGSCGLLCYDLNGKVLWQKELPIPSTKTFGTGTSPAVIGDLVVLNGQGEGLPLRAVHRKTGAPAWDAAFIGAGYSVPVLWRHDGIEQIIVQSRTRLTSFNLNGTMRWSIEGMPLDAITTPVLGDGHLFVNFTTPGGDAQDRTLMSFDDALAKYDKNKDNKLTLDELPKDLVFIDRGVGYAGTEGGDITIDRLIEIKKLPKELSRELWEKLRHPKVEGGSGLMAFRPGAKGVVERKDRVWSTNKNLPEVPSPLYYRGNLYLFRKGGIASCLDARTGKELAKERLVPATGNYYSSPVAGDGKIYVAAESGMLFVIEAGNDLKVLAPNNLGERIMATPAIADGTLYVRTERHLFAFRD